MLPGTIVKSGAGHDAGRFYLVVKADHDAVYIADGKRRKLEAPKRKNRRHLCRTTQTVEIEQITTNQQVRRVLWPYNYGGESLDVS
ncbi:MAG TPA: KOW domain-containing RNA-binding protein [Firmicutes bacterium]|nr:KOW domain-containing RNA-binding protein [Bacillota bacterium]